MDVSAPLSYWKVLKWHSVIFAKTSSSQRCFQTGDSQHDDTLEVENKNCLESFDEIPEDMWRLLSYLVKLTLQNYRPPDINITQSADAYWGARTTEQYVWAVLSISQPVRKRVSAGLTYNPTNCMQQLQAHNLTSWQSCTPPTQAHLQRCQIMLTLQQNHKKMIRLHSSLRLKTLDL